ncbi:hypothetical protein [Anaerolentibacter hominis]|uniref:hypothetical protein n=1 Tax=Anaerolentibacter hominis TaxID=3079009 RepID=UPI0031B810F5
MMVLYELREKMKRLYQSYGRFIVPVCKFLITLVILLVMNKNIGYFTKLTRLPIVLGVSVIGALVPPSILVLLMAALSLIHIFMASKILFVIAVFVIFVVYFLFARFTPEQGLVMLLVPVMFVFKLPYLIPLLLGIFAGPLSIMPVVCGTVVYFLFNVLKTVALSTTGTSMEDALTLYRLVMDNLIGNKTMLYSILVFAAVIVIMYIIRRTKINYSFEISIGAGTLVMIIGFLIADLKTGVSGQIFSMLLLTLLSGFITLCVQFFRFTLDYTRTEITQFEDEDYYYYVKAVPKIFVTEPEKSVKHFSDSRTSRNRKVEKKRPGRPSEPSEDPEEEFLKSFANIDDDDDLSWK